MTYKIKRIYISILLITTITLIVIFFYGAMYLSTHNIVNKTNPILPLMFFGGFLSVIFNLFFINHRTSTCFFTKENLNIDGTKINWDEIKTYKISDESAEFKTLKIKTVLGKTFNISHRKRFAKKDDFEKFILAFENQLFHLRDKGIVVNKISSIWDTKTGKIYGYIIIAILMAYTVIILTKDVKTSQMVNYFIFLALSIPLMIRVFGKKKNG